MIGDSHATEAAASSPSSQICDVCVVTFNSAETIGRLLLSLRTDPPAHFRVFDNASTDGTLEVVEKLRSEIPFPIEITPSATNVGFPVAANYLLRRCTSPVVALVNPDVELTPDTLSYLVKCLQQDRSIAIATCRLMTRDGRPQSEPARSRPRLRRLLAGQLPIRLGRRFHSVQGPNRLYRDFDVECMSGALMVFRRDLLDGIGYLDESVFMYLEDIDFAARVQRAGYRIRYVGSHWAWHDSGVSVAPNASRLYALLPEVWLAYLDRYGCRYEQLAARPTLVAVCAVEVIKRLGRRELPRGELKAVWKALVHRPAEGPLWS